MIKSNKTKKILLMIIVFLAIIFLKNKVYAITIGADCWDIAATYPQRTDMRSDYDIEYTTNLYCIQSSASLFAPKVYYYVATYYLDTANGGNEAKLAYVLAADGLGRQNYGSIQHTSSNGRNNFSYSFYRISIFKTTWSLEICSRSNRICQ